MNNLLWISHAVWHKITSFSLSSNTSWWSIRFTLVYSTDRKAISYPIFRDRPLGWTSTNSVRPLKKNTLSLARKGASWMRECKGQSRPRVLARAGNDQPDVDIRASLSRSPGDECASRPALFFHGLQYWSLFLDARRRGLLTREMHLSIKRHLHCYCCRRKINQRTMSHIPSRIYRRFQVTMLVIYFKRELEIQEK